MRLPLLGRLGAFEWPVLIFSLILVVAEYILTVITGLLPSFVIHFFDALTYSLFRLIPTSGINKVSANPELDHRATEIASADGFVEMCNIYGYQAEEHIVKTTDGYLLGIHRIGGPKNSNWRHSESPSPKPVVYLHHGLLMNSEIWVANVDPNRCLPFVLADMGYDVWLGNNRGNKYSKKHVTHNPNSIAFWNFSIDDFALYDIPDTINYILYIVSQKDLVYIGFSQGSAQAFATLSINPELNKKVRLFIALAPAMAPPGLQNTIVDSLMRASPSLIYLFFGRKAIMKSATFWQSIMYPPLFVHTIDTSISSLFKWESKNIPYAQKLAAYPHLYSYTSVKSVVHWFQIIRSGRFHMYDDDVEGPFSSKNKYFYRVASFPTQNITSPILLLYGKSDSLVDIKVMLDELPVGTESIGFDSYEHLDMIWGERVDKLIFPYIFSALKCVDHLSPERHAFDNISRRNGPLPALKLMPGKSSRSELHSRSLELPSKPLSLHHAPYANKAQYHSFHYSHGAGSQESTDSTRLAQYPGPKYSEMSTLNTLIKESEEPLVANYLSGQAGRHHQHRSSRRSSLQGTRPDFGRRVKSRSCSCCSEGDLNNLNLNTVDDLQSLDNSDGHNSLNNSLAYDRLAHQLSTSFSDTGINFGSSQPVVEVIHSDAGSNE